MRVSITIGRNTRMWKTVEGLPKNAVWDLFENVKDRVEDWFDSADIHWYVVED